MAIKFKKIVSFLCLVSLLMMISIPNASATSNGIVLTVSNVTAQAGTEVEVPVILSQNTSGVLAMQLSMSYDSRLAFKSIKQGDALTTLNLTPLKDFSANPCTILLDGLDADVSNGTILILTFAVPSGAAGDYDVSLSYNVGEVYDDDMNDIDVTIVNGGIKVKTSQPEVTEPTLEVDECTKGTNTVSFDVFAKSPDELAGNIIVSSYKAEGVMDKIKIYPVASKVSVTVDTAAAKYIKVMWWNMSNIEPFTKHIKFNIN